VAVAFVDADIGQKDVGPPATITLARVGREGIWMGIRSIPSP